VCLASCGRSGLMCRSGSASSASCQRPICSQTRFTDRDESRPPGRREQIRARIGVYNNAFQAIADHEAVIIISGVDVARQRLRYADPYPPHTVALTYLLEWVDDYAAKHDELVLVIADEVHEQDQHRRSLWEYQRFSTWGYRSRQLQRIVDAIHFAPSSASRLLQAADLVAFFYRRLKENPETDERAKRANAALWERLRHRVVKAHCWYP
jgi:hypothetical protein